VSLGDKKIILIALRLGTIYIRSIGRELKGKVRVYNTNWILTTNKIQHISATNVSISENNFCLF
jgi:hypothetical protein